MDLWRLYNSIMEWKYFFCFAFHIILGFKMIDDKAFIFTLKNPNGVEPTRYMKRKESGCAIYCYHDNGPTFGSSSYYDIYIAKNCTQDGNGYTTKSWSGDGIYYDMHY